MSKERSVAQGQITVWQSPRGDYKAWSEDSWMYTWGASEDEAVSKLRRRMAARAVPATVQSQKTSNDQKGSKNEEPSIRDRTLRDVERYLTSAMKKGAIFN